MSRIVLVVSKFPQLSETFIVNKFLGLLAQGWDVHLVCGKFQAANWQSFPGLAKHPRLHQQIHPTWPFEPRILALLLLPWALLTCLLRAPSLTFRYLWNGWSRFGFRVFWQFYLDAALILLRPDLIHFEFGALAPERMYLRELLGCQILVSFRGYDLNFVGLENPQYYQPVWEQADALHLLGEDLWRRAQQRGCPADKIHALIPPAIDLELFTPSGLDFDTEHPADLTRPLRILSVGRLEWKKGYEYAFQAVSLLIEQGIACEYHLVGDGDAFESVAFARHQFSLEKKSELLGAQPQAVIKQQLEWADVFLHTALSEGFCNVVLEAQAMGVPVVCSDAGGLPENVLDQVTGFVVPRRNPVALADKLALLARDPILRQTMGQQARARVVSCFQLAGQIERFTLFYKDVLALEH